MSIYFALLYFHSCSFSLQVVKTQVTWPGATGPVVLVASFDKASEDSANYQNVMDESGFSWWSQAMWISSIYDFKLGAHERI